MLGYLRRRGNRKTPKRLRFLRFRVVGPWLYLGSDRRKTVRAALANPLWSYFRGALPTARLFGETRVGVRDRQTQGDSTLRKKNGVSRRAWRRSRGCARTLFVSLQKSIGGFGSEKPFSHYVILRKGDGKRCGREPGLRMYPIVPSRVRCSRRPGFPNEALRCEATRGGGSRRRRKTDSRQAGCATPRLLDAGSEVRKVLRDPRRSSRRANPRGTGCAISTRESGRRAAHPPSNEGALDREKLRRVTAAGWKRSRRVSPNRSNVHREKARTGIEGGSRQGRQR